MLEHHTDQTVCKMKVMERSIFSSQYCFTKNLANQQIIDESEEAVLNKWFEFITTNELFKVDYIVYLQTTPEVSYERLQKRNRSEEKNIKLEQIKELHKLHEEWLVEGKSPIPAPVLILNADKNIDEVKSDFLSGFSKIMMGLHSHIG